MRIIGRGRYAGETYPVGPGGGSGGGGDSIIRILDFDTVEVPAGSAAFAVEALSITAAGAGSAIVLAGALPANVNADAPGVPTLAVAFNVTLDGVPLSPLCAANFGIDGVSNVENLSGQLTFYRRIFIPVGTHTLTLFAATNADTTANVGPGQLYILGNPALITF